jgi:nucleotide-binding universal stress UspA family protein
MKVLLTIDGSTYSAWATDLLSSLPLAKSPAITVLHVVETIPAVHAMLTPSERQAYTAALRQQMERKRAAGQQLVAKTTDRLRKHWKSVRGVVDEGPVADTIISRARREKTDLIVLGSRGFGHVQKFVLGSVSHKVTTYAPCSVFVVKTHTRHRKKVLVALDGSPYAENAAVFLGSMFKKTSIRPTAVYVWESPERVPVLESAAALIKDRCDGVMQRAGLEADFQFVIGHPEKEIVRIAQQQHVGLVVVGSKGLTGLKRFLLGGISHEVVLHRPASVLVFRR